MNLNVVADSEGLLANASVPLEPLATELLRGPVGGVRPFDGDFVLMRVLTREVSGVVLASRSDSWGIGIGF